MTPLTAEEASALTDNAEVLVNDVFSAYIRQVDERISEACRARQRQLDIAVDPAYSEAAAEDLRQRKFSVENEKTSLRISWP